MTISASQGAFFGLVYLSVGLWEYIMFQRKHTAYPYKEGFAIFSVVQWIGIFIGMIGIFGLKWGVAAGITCMTALQFLCHFTIGRLWDRLAQANYLLPTAIFAVTVWVVLAFGVYHFM